MKKLIAMVFFGCLATLMMAAVGVANVKMEDHYSAVCRVVISLTEKANYTVSESPGELMVNFADFDQATKARIYTAKSDLITGIEQDDEVLRLAIGKPYRYETMTFDYPARLVLDVFMSSPNKSQRLVIADFYSEMGKFSSADRAYSALHSSYPNDAQILYHWALLLAKRHSSRASEKLAMIPQSSQYYDRAQKLAAKLGGETTTPAVAAPVAPEPTPVVPSEPAVQESVITAPPKPAPKVDKSLPAVPKPVVKNAHNPFLLHILLLIGLGVLLVVVLYFLFTGKRTPRFDPLADDLPDPKEEEEANKALKRMVMKLSDDGWTPKEIAKEMKMSTEQVERLIRFCPVDSIKNGDK